MTHPPRETVKLSTTPTHDQVSHRQPRGHRQQAKKAATEADNRDDVMTNLSRPTDKRFDLRPKNVTVLTR